MKRLQVGDLVQWQKRDGMIMLPAPKRITDFSPRRDYAFLEGSRCGIPIEEVVIVQPAFNPYLPRRFRQ
jgi:hypothetical protein